MNDAALDISEARKQLSHIDKRLKKDRLIWITRHNRKAFAIVSMDLTETLLETLAIVRDPKALKALQESLRDIRAGRLHDHEEIERELL